MDMDTKEIIETAITNMDYTFTVLETLCEQLDLNMNAASGEAVYNFTERHERIADMYLLTDKLLSESYNMLKDAVEKGRCKE